MGKEWADEEWDEYVDESAQVRGCREAFPSPHRFFAVSLPLALGSWALWRS